VFRAEGISVRTGVAAAGVKQNGDGVTLVLASGEETAADRLLVAVGRQPAAGHLGLENAGVRLDERGHIVTGRHLGTTAPGTYAAGDVTGRMPFTHAAHAMGRLAVRNALRHRWSPPAPFTTAVIPWVVFTDPEVAQVGLTEPEAAATRPGARVVYLPMSEADRAVTAGRTEGFVTIIACRRRVLGNAGGGRVIEATIVAARAGEMIHEPALAMRTGMFTGRLAQAVHAYPTWSLAIQQAAAQFFGRFGGRTARPAEPGPRRARSPRHPLPHQAARRASGTSDPGPGQALRGQRDKRAEEHTRLCCRAWWVRAPSGSHPSRPRHGAGACHAGRFPARQEPGRRERGTRFPQRPAIPG
jgi:Pyridine nucleotide-disulphide oxidoreductase, dimerisation domain/Pyridine nucleotide-disulphide oxidoreductase